jgi:hypothetical protein
MLTMASRAPAPGALLDPLANNAPTSSMLLGIMLYDATAETVVWCDVLQIPRKEPNKHVLLGRYDVRFISSIVIMDAPP